MYFYITLSALIFATGATGSDFNLRSHQDMNDEVKVQKLRNELDILEEIANSMEEFKLFCPQDTKECPDGSYVSRDDSCKFRSCPGVRGEVINKLESEINFLKEEIDGGFCITDVKKCPDGSYVSRDPDNNCAFESCPVEIDQTICASDVKECPDGSYVSRDHSNNCEFHSCSVVCASDLHQCWYGSYVSRDPDNNCAFESCHWW